MPTLTAVDEHGNRVQASYTVINPVTRPVALFNRVTYKYSSLLSAAQAAGRYSIMAMQSTDQAAVAALRAAKPALAVLLYVTGLRLANNIGWTSVPLSAASLSWHLTDQAGNPIIDSNGLALVDPASPAFQQAFIQHATSWAQQRGFNGIFIDELNASLVWALPAGVSCPKYPTDTSWQAAVSAFINAVGPALRAAGLVTIGNLGGTAWFPGLWQQWNGPLDGAMEEAWTDGGDGLAQQLPDWPKKIANVAWSEANGKLTILHSHNTTRAGNAYGLASMLLVAGGGASYCTANADYTSDEQWYPEYTAALALGVPIDPPNPSPLPSGLRARRFAGGVAIVNATAKPITDPVYGTVPATTGLIN